MNAGEQGGQATSAALSPLGAPTDVPSALGLRMPAEWEPHAATWLAWPHNASDWPGKFETVFDTFTTLIGEVHRVERVRLIVQDAAARRHAEQVLGGAGVALSQLDFHEAPTNRSWTRDWVPLFVVGGREVAAVRWRFDGWARYDDHALDDAAGGLVPGWRGVRCWEPRAHFSGAERRIVLEGGAIDVDGQGTALLSEQCMLDGPNARNRGLGRAALERALADYLGIERVVWLRDGIVGDDTSGHVDDFVRFVAPARVVLAHEPDPAAPDHAALEAARERLEGAVDARGRHLEIVRLPVPAPVLWGQERLPASYANFYIANQLVLVPTFDDPKDTLALGILQDLLAPRRVVGIHARDFVLGLGTLHCTTMQEPAVPTAARAAEPGKL